jgi:hypothetical protein
MVRVLNTKMMFLRLFQDGDTPRPPRCAALSHVHGSNEAVYNDFEDLESASRFLFEDRNRMRRDHERAQASRQGFEKGT